MMTKAALPQTFSCTITSPLRTTGPGSKLLWARLAKPALSLPQAQLVKGTYFSSPCKYTCLGQELGLGGGKELQREGGYGIGSFPPRTSLHVALCLPREAGPICQSRAQPSGLFEAFAKMQLGSKSAQTDPDFSHRGRGLWLMRISCCTFAWQVSLKLFAFCFLRDGTRETGARWNKV